MADAWGVHVNQTSLLPADPPSDYPLMWRVRTRLKERFGQRCRIVVRGALNSALVEFESDKYRVVTSRNYVRKAA